MYKLTFYIQIFYFILFDILLWKQFVCCYSLHFHSFNKFFILIGFEFKFTYQRQQKKDPKQNVRQTCTIHCRSKTNEKKNNHFFVSHLPMDEKKIDNVWNDTSETSMNNANNARKKKWYRNVNDHSFHIITHFFSALFLFLLLLTHCRWVDVYLQLCVCVPV